ncbi:CocE/NonD family hydrolase [Actinoplanes sp. HUAS TT8]|uniref:CocE/NonD family hydrolase n=1 Tax=Actinoplanes sp. HUAS TT8 TaxID=3447453 RepID=UPI003F524A78
MRANVRLTASDGAVLVADAYPAAGGAATPVVVTRTPYDRAAHRAEGFGWSRHGFGYVVQDVRGRYGSDGVWRPYHGERADGAELIDWILAQPWCDGRIVALGGSYSAYTAWTMAVERSPAVRAVISFGAAMGLARVKFDRSGILRLAEHATWWAERAEARTSRTGLAADMFAARPDLIRHLPVTDLEHLMWPDLREWTDVVDRGPEHVDAEAVRDDEIAALTAASLHVGGWYDLLLDETLHQWRTAGDRGSLLIGPWDHDLGHGGTTIVGDRDHGADSRVRIGEVLLNWVRTVLNRERPHPDARVFVIGQGWTDHERWPPPAGTRTWHIDPAGTSFVYDPADPYPSANPGADRSPLIAGRADAARFAGEPLDTAITITGRPVADVDVDGDGDVVVRLIEVSPDGTAIAVTQGTRESRTGGPITLDETAVRVAAGSRLLLEITGGDFPHLARWLADDRYRGTAVAPVRRHVRRIALHLPIGEDT